MDVNLINAFVTAVQHVFRTVAGMEVEVQKPTINKPPDIDTDVSGVIGYSGDVVGACILCFPSDVACALVKAFIGEETSVESPDFADAIGELANMVAGNAKAKFEGCDVSISLPSVITGKNHHVEITEVPSDQPRLMIPCNTTAGAFYLEVVMLAPKKTGSRSTQEAPAAG